MRLLILSMLVSNLCVAQSFLMNTGQLDHLGKNHSESIQYYISIDGLDYFFSSDKIHIVGHQWNDEYQSSRSSERIVLSFQRASANSIIPSAPKQGVQRYIRQSLSNECVAYDTLTYLNIWPHVDAKFYVWKGKLKWDYIVHPGGRVSDVKWKYIGAESTLSKRAVYLKSNIIRIKSNYPKVYQNKNESVDFQIQETEKGLGIKVGSYDLDQDLIIDPWANYLGGTDVDENYGIDVDDQGNVYTSGYTISTDFPTTPGVLSTTSDLDYDAYVTKYDSTGALIWSTYYAGSGGDYGRNVKVDNQGNTYLFGNTTSNDLAVSSSGVYQSASNGSYDSFILKLNNNGQFVWATYFGGNNGDIALAGDLKGDRLAIGGYTSSMNMPVVNGFQTTHGGALDGFIAVFDTTGNIQWSTFYGGSNSEDGHAIAFDDSGNVIMTGDSYSNNLPTSTGAYQAANNGGQECYMVKFDPAGNRLFGTYFGGIGNDDALAVKSINGKIYVAGFTRSNDFPVTPGCYKDSLSSIKDGYFARFSSTGQLEYASYYGGNDDDEFTAMDVRDNRIALLMNTRSDSMDIYGIPKQTYKGLYSDTYVIMFDTAFSPGFSTYYGGESSEYGYGIKLFDDHTIHWSFHTGSTNLSFGANQNTLTSNTDAMVVKLDMITGYFTQVSSPGFENQIQLYPNPSCGRITIESASQIGEFKILDGSGKMMLTKKTRNRDIDLSVVPNGIYHITVLDEKGNLIGSRSIVIDK